MNRRHFIQATSTAIAATPITSSLKAGTANAMAKDIDFSKFKGFNLLEKFWLDNNEPFKEEDFEMMAEWGFNFARLPMSYWTWGDPKDWDYFDETVLNEIEAAVDLGRQYGIHVNINFHRAPGYCVNDGHLEPYQLFEDQIAVDATRKHWMVFAEMFKGVSNEYVTFDMLNEPKDIPVEVHNPVMSQIIEGIRSVDPDRTIVVDGLRYGRDPIFGLDYPNMVQSTRGYDPFQLTHYKAGWVNSSNWPLPTWPFVDSSGKSWEAEEIWEDRIVPWQKLEATGTQVHAGEWGVYKYTPHDVTLEFFKANLSNWRKARWGWALWNLRGDFGFLNSGRADVNYEKFHGHQLDRKMLELLLEDLELSKG